MPDLLTEAKDEVKRLQRIFEKLLNARVDIATANAWLTMTNRLTFGKLLTRHGEDYSDRADVEYVKDIPEADLVCSLIDSGTETLNRPPRGKSFPVDLTIAREGLYDETACYLVWEPEDVERIINLLRGGEDGYE